MTSRAPVPAAEIGQPRRPSHSSGQRRLRELEPRQPPGRPAPADSQRDRPKDAGPGRASAAATGRSRLPKSGHLVFSALAASGTRVREGCQAAATNWSGCAPLGSRRLRPRVSRRARRRRLLVFSARAARVKFARLVGGGQGPQATPAGARTRGKDWGAEAWGPGLQ